jgi:hypothetical protein
MMTTNRLTGSNPLFLNAPSTRTVTHAAKEAPKQATRSTRRETVITRLLRSISSHNAALAVRIWLVRTDYIYEQSAFNVFLTIIGICLALDRSGMVQIRNKSQFFAVSL